jgi:hypothetical protein
MTNNNLRTNKSKLPHAKENEVRTPSFLTSNKDPATSSLVPHNKPSQFLNSCTNLTQYTLNPETQSWYVNNIQNIPKHQENLALPYATTFKDISFTF